MGILIKLPELIKVQYDNLVAVETKKLIDLFKHWRNKSTKYGATGSIKVVLVVSNRDVKVSDSIFKLLLD